MKLISLITLSFIFVTSIFGQNSSPSIKSESMNYLDGKASYQYYEDQQTYEFVKHGSFNYTENLKGKFGTKSVIINGQFKNGLREGSWSFSVLKKDFENQNGTYTTQTMSSTQNYKNGKPNGSWVLNNTLKARPRLVVSMQYVWGDYEVPINELVSVEFKDGILVGTATYTENGVKSTNNLTQEGFITGDYSEYFGGAEKTEMSFNDKGVMTKNLRRWISTGADSDKKDFDSDLLSTADKYLNGELNLSDLSESNIKLDTVTGILSEVQSLFDLEYFRLSSIGGDQTITSNTDKRIYGRYFWFQRISIIPYAQHPRWPNYFNGYTNTQSKIKSYQDFLTIYGKEISKADCAEIQNLIKASENELNNSRNQENAKKEYYSLYKQLGAKLLVPSKASITDAINPYSDATHVFSRNTKSTLSKYSTNAKKMFFTNKYEKDDFSQEGYKGKDNDYVSSLNNLKEYTSFLDNRQNVIDSLSTLISLFKDISFYVNEIECKYITNQSLSTFNAYSSDTPRQTIKQKFYNAYLNVFENILKETGSVKSYTDYYNYALRISSLCRYVNYAYDSKTSNIEKELKGAADYKTQLAIFEKYY